jgi:hypothetical protein
MEEKMWKQRRIVIFARAGAISFVPIVRSINQKERKVLVMNE